MNAPSTETATLSDIAEQCAPQKTPHLVGIYDSYLNRIRDQPVRLLEIGVKGGGSVRMWRTYFADGLIYGLDLKEGSLSHAEERVRMFMGDQTDPATLDRIVAQSGPLDIVVDDGSHQPADQQFTLRHLWPHVKPGGFYIVEDIHTSYRQERFDAGWRKHGTTVEFLKQIVDDIHAATHGEPVLLGDVAAVHFHRRTAVLEKVMAVPDADRVYR